MYDYHSSDNMIVNECKGWELGVGGLGGGCVGLVCIGWGSVPENGVGLVHCCSSTSIQKKTTQTDCYNPPPTCSG